MWFLMGVICQGGPPARVAEPVCPLFQMSSNHVLTSMSVFAIGVPPAARMPPCASSTFGVAGSSAIGQVRAFQVPLFVSSE